MVDKIEMSLDDIIQESKTNNSGKNGRKDARKGGSFKNIRRGGGGQTGGFRGGNNRQGGSGSGGVQKGGSRGGITRSKYTRGDVNSAWKHDMFDGPRKNLLSRGGGGGLGGGRGGSSPSKLLVSNLDFGVSESDINELFAEFGPLKNASVHYDRSGRSLGTADVVFERKADAAKAMTQYNGVPLDGRPMNIQLATSDLPTAGLNRNRIGGGGGGSGAGGSQGGNQRMQRGNGGNNSFGGRGGSRGGRGGNRDGGRNNNKKSGGGGAPVQKKTAEELDAELDAYVKDMK